MRMQNVINVDKRHKLGSGWIVGGDALRNTRKIHLDVYSVCGEGEVNINIKFGFSVMLSRYM
jgi:hypothetical protein